MTAPLLAQVKQPMDSNLTTEQMRMLVQRFREIRKVPGKLQQVLEEENPMDEELDNVKVKQASNKKPTLVTTPDLENLL